LLPLLRAGRARVTTQSSIAAASNFDESCSAGRAYSQSKIANLRYRPARDAADAARLWEVSETLVGVQFAMAG
jgi:hypothetical protein